MSLHILDSEDLFAELESSAKPLVATFSATWCGPCKQFAPVLESLAEQMSESFAFVKVDVDKFPDIASRFDVMAVPTTVVLENGEVLISIAGARNAQNMMDELTSVI